MRGRYSLQVLVFFGLFTLAGCPFGGRDDDCTSGRTIPCDCSDGSSGLRTCEDRRYGECVCGGGDGGTTDGGGGSCSGGRTFCDDLCVDTTDDPRYCGSCQTACALGEVCQASDCVDAGDCRENGCSGFTYCDLGDGLCKPGCIEDTQCPAGEACDLVTHSCGCGGGLQRCAGECRDTTSDEAHCGVCNDPCPAGAECIASDCVCTGALVACAGACVDTQTSSVHCGDCNQPCDSVASCLDGECVCPGTQRHCDGECVDTTSDPRHCNGCGLPCTGDEICQDSTCIPPPDCRTEGCTGFTWCDTATGRCEPGCATDPQCPTGEVCNTGTHQCQCPPGEQRCSGVCTDISSDSQHCGGCGRPCGVDQYCAGNRCEDVSNFCAGYSSTGRLDQCDATTTCSSASMECVPINPLVSYSACLDTTPCEVDPAAGCCEPGQHCGTASGLVPALGAYFCCTPGEAIPDGFFGAACEDAGLDLACTSDADCPAASTGWGRPYCMRSGSPRICVECASDAHCGGQRCSLAEGECVECLGAGDCGGSTPVCDPSTNECVGCTSDSHCSAPTPACEQQLGICVECTSDGYCSSPDPYCNTGNGSCVECRNDSHCADPTPVCDGFQCRQCPVGAACQTMQSGRRACYQAPFLPTDFCQTDADCGTFAPGQICDAPAGGYKNCAYACP